MIEETVNIDATSEPLTFFVHGVPATQGSKIGFKHGVTNKVVVKEDCHRNPAWRADVAHTAYVAMKARGGELITGPVALTLDFYVPRAKKHFTRSGALSPNAPRWPTTIPDLSKMVRAVEDALKGHVWHDDSQVCHSINSKAYADDIGPGVRVTVNAFHA